VTKLTLSAALAGGSAILWGALPGLAQTAPDNTPGILYTATLASKLTASDNYNLDVHSLGNAFLWDNILTLGMKSETPVDSFDMTTAGTLRFSDLPKLGTDTQLDDANIAAVYSRAIDDSNAKVSVNYTDVNVAFNDPLNQVSDSGVFQDYRGKGRESLTRGFASLNLGTEAPLSFSVSASGQNLNYRDTTDPSLRDSTRATASAEIGALITPSMRAIASVDASTYQVAEGYRDSHNYNAYVGLKGDITAATHLIARIGYGESHSSYSTRADRDNSSMVGQLRFTGDLVNGDAWADLSVTQDTNGPRTTFMLGRDLALQRGKISGSLGVSNSQGTTLRPVSNLSYSLANPLTGFTVNWRQNFDTDDDGDEVLYSNLSARIWHGLTPTTEVALAVSAGQKQYLGNNADGSDVTLMTLTANLSHQLTEQWSMTTGYTHRTRDEQDEGTAQSNAVFLNVQRTFSVKR